MVKSTDAVCAHQRSTYSTILPEWQAQLLTSFLSTSPTAIVSLLLAPILIVVVTRIFSERRSKTTSNQDIKSVWMLPYSVPVVGHGFALFLDPINLIASARDGGLAGIFALNLGATTHNFISDPALVKSVMQQKESAIQFRPIAWTVAKRFFGIPSRSKPKYLAHWEELNSLVQNMMQEPYLEKLLKITVNNLENIIPQMVTFMEADIDLQPWEKSAQATYLSGSESKINLMAMVRDMLGRSSIPSIFGQAFMNNFPNILQDVYEMDQGLIYFLLKLPAWTPWAPVLRAHIARSRVWAAMDMYQKALDAHANGNSVGVDWDDMEDVCPIITQRNKIYREHGFEITERGDISILWALLANANLAVYWQLLYILATPGLVDRVRAEISPFIEISKPVSIGTISEAPKMRISHKDLSGRCPLFKSTYFEALRCSSQPWSFRKVDADTCVSGVNKVEERQSFMLRKGEYVTIPHSLHMLDPHYFPEPENFKPERFIIENEDGTLTANSGSIRPYGDGSSICKGRSFAERQCLSLVAGILMFWDIEPADKGLGWAIPKQMTNIFRPTHETEVKIKRRLIKWD